MKRRELALCALGILAVTAGVSPLNDTAIDDAIWLGPDMVMPAGVLRSLDEVWWQDREGKDHTWHNPAPLP